MGYEQSASAVVGVASVVLGLVVALFGYDLLRAALALAGFLLGAIAAGTVAALAGAGDPAVLGFAVGGGMLGALIFGGLYLAGVFALGAMGGALVAGAAASSLSGLAHGAAVVATGLVGGLLAVRLRRPVLAVCSALVGAAAMVAGALHLVLGAQEARDVGHSILVRGDPSGSEWVVLGAWAGLTALASATQLRGGRRRGRR